MAGRQAGTESQTEQSGNRTAEKCKPRWARSRYVMTTNSPSVTRLKIRFLGGNMKRILVLSGMIGLAAIAAEAGVFSIAKAVVVHVAKDAYHAVKHVAGDAKAAVK